MNTVVPKFTYRKKSLYKIARTFGDERINTGYDYTDTVMKKTLSPYIFRNATMTNFITYINDYIVNLINATKKFKVRRVYTVDKDYEYID